MGEIHDISKDEEDAKKYNEEIDKQNRQIEEENKELTVWIDDITAVLKALIDDIQSNKEYMTSEGYSKWKENFIGRLEISDKFKEYLME